jgi:DNA-binding protein HU-beta
LPGQEEKIMNKVELIDRVAEDMQGTKADARTAVTSVFHHIAAAVAAGDVVIIAGFGKFEKTFRPARTGRNPASGAAVDIPESHLPKFRAATQLKTQVAEGR